MGRTKKSCSPFAAHTLILRLNEILSAQCSAHTLFYMGVEKYTSLIFIYIHLKWYNNKCLAIFR